MTLNKKIKKLKNDPDKFIADFISKRPKLRKKLNTVSDKIPFFNYHKAMYFKYKKLGFNVKAENTLKKALSYKKDSQLYYEFAKILERKKQWWQTVEAYNNAIKLHKNPPKSWYKNFALALTRMNRYNDSANAWKEYLKKDTKNADDWFLYGYNLEKTNRKNEAKEVYKKAVFYDKNLNSKDLGIGVFYEKRGWWVEAEKSYREFVEQNPLNAWARYRHGLSLDRCYRWNEAEISLKEAIALDPTNIYWYYRLGFVRERQGKYAKAAEAYEYAVKNSNKHIPYWYYRLGYVLYKIFKYQKACEAFLMMKKIKLDQLNPDLSESDDMLNFQFSKNKNFLTNEDLLKIVLETDDKKEIIEFIKKNFPNISNDVRKILLKQDYKEKLFNKLAEENNKQEKEKNKYEEERKKQTEEKLKILKRIYVIKNSIKKDTSNVELWYSLAVAYKNLKNYKKAEYAYKKTIERKNCFDGNLYFELGCVLVKQGKYAKASKAFMEQRILQEAHGVSEEPYNKDVGFKRVVNYTEYYERFDIEEHMILYESYHGASVSCNPYAIFKALFENEHYNNYTHIWVINDLNKVPVKFKKYENIIFVQRQSDLYMRYLAKAKYLINNVTFPEYFIRKEGQVYLNTWHGTPIKSLGKDIKDDFMAHKNAVRNFLHATHLIHPNEHTKNIMTERHDIDGLYQGINSVTGYPRQDLMLNMTAEEKEKIKEILKIDKHKKVVLYAPTWRGVLSGAKFDKDKLIKDLHVLKSIKDTVLVFRGHHMVKKLLSDVDELSGIVVANDIDCNELLSITDILITDYSSIAIDYMALERPIIYYTYDRREYQQERGLYFPLEDLGDDICTNIHDLKKTVQQKLFSPVISFCQKKAQERFCSYDDGSATKRVIDLVFNNQKETKVYHKSNILMYGGSFIPNGITTSFLNITQQIDKEKYNVAIVIDPANIKDNQQRLNQLNRIDKKVKILNRFYRTVLSLEEKWINDKIDIYKGLPSQEMYDVLYKSYKREFKRVFGNAKFDTIVNFESYHSYWVRILAAPSHSNKVVYLHNELLGEARVRFPYLYSNINIYANYHKHISVSYYAYKANKQNLVNYGLIPSNFDYCDNVLNYNEIIKRSNEPLEFSKEKKLFVKGKTFINIARLSPEKDQVKLIKAFSRVVKKHPESRLIILGQGPLETELQILVKKLSMEKNVFILGHRFNPMPYLKLADCFVLSSNYEGQGLVLLEAMVLDKPVISTDIPGPRSILKDKYGLLAENSEDGLIQGMLDFLEGRYVEKRKFDYKKYNQEAINMFYSKVIGN